MNIKLEGLKAGYDRTVIVDDVNIVIQPGSIVSVIGPNGCGKSTVLKSITRQIKILGGKVFIGDTDSALMKDSEMAKHISMVMTERIRPEMMNCREIVETGRYPYTGRMGILSEEDRRIALEAMSMVNALDIKDKAFDRISDGQRQRVMLARAICQDTDIMILDEPTSFLDMKYKLDILENIRRLAKEKNIAVFMSLHELDLARQISDTIITVENGRIGKAGKPEEVFRDGYIQRLYGVDEECFDENTAMLFMKKTDSVPRVFVIGGGGKSIPVYQRLSREGTAFAAGIVYENDVEMPYIRGLAQAYVSVRAFEEITEADYIKALEMLDKCECCISVNNEFKGLNKYNGILYEYASDNGKLMDDKR